MKVTVFLMCSPDHIFLLEAVKLKMLLHHLLNQDSYDSPSFIELAYPRYTAEQYLVSEQPTFI